MFHFCNPSRNPSVCKLRVDRTLALREDEGPQLTKSQRSQVDELLYSLKECFAPGGEATDYIEHCINLVLGHHPPSTPRRKDRKEQPAEKEFAKIPTTFVESALLHVRDKTETHQGRQKRYVDNWHPPNKYLLDLTLFTGHHRMTPDPIHPIRRRGSPRKKLSEAGPSPRTIGQTRGGDS
jgi:hypothetical protein